MKRKLTPCCPKSKRAGHRGHHHMDTQNKKLEFNKCHPYVRLTCTDQKNGMPHPALGGVRGSFFDLDLANTARVCHDSGNGHRPLSRLRCSHLYSESPGRAQREEHTNHAHTHKGNCSRTPAIVQPRLRSRASDRRPCERSAAAQPRSGWLRSGDRRRAYRN